jgi:manganese/zinc/iron transport system permease protein
MLLGALAAALLAVFLIGLVRRVARLESGAATGAVFTSFFALGLMLMEATGARSVDLDLDCVLFGQLESVVWLEAQGFASLFDPVALAALPRQLFLLAAVAVVLAGLVALLWRPLHLLCFDPDYAAAIGLPARGLELALNLMVAAAAVAAFEAVGSILVVAMLVCPAAAIRLLTDSYRAQVLGGAVLGAALGALGYALAGPLPAAFGQSFSLNAAGVIGTLGGVTVAGAMLLRQLRNASPKPAITSG